MTAKQLYDQLASLPSSQAVADHLLAANCREDRDLDRPLSERCPVSMWFHRADDRKPGARPKATRNHLFPHARSMDDVVDTPEHVAAFIREHDACKHPRLYTPDTAS